MVFLRAAIGQTSHVDGPICDVVGGGASCHLPVVLYLQVPTAGLPPPPLCLHWRELPAGVGLCLHWRHHHQVREREGLKDGGWGGCSRLDQVRDCGEERWRMGGGCSRVRLKRFLYMVAGNISVSMIGNDYNCCSVKANEDNCFCISLFSCPPHPPIPPSHPLISPSPILPSSHLPIPHSPIPHSPSSHLPHPRLSSRLQLDCHTNGDPHTQTLGSVITTGQWHHLIISVLPVSMQPMYKVSHICTMSCICMDSPS